MKSYRRIKTTILNLAENISRQDKEIGELFKQNLIFDDLNETITYTGTDDLLNNLKESKD